MIQEPFIPSGGSRSPHFSILPWGSFIDVRAGFTKRIASKSRTLLVKRERALLAREGFSNPGYSISQVHGNAVGVVRRPGGARKHFAADALVTSERNIPLLLHYADCVPVYFFDPASLCVGLAHAGWRGTALKVCGRVIETFAKVYGSDPRTVLAAVGPSIKPCCYEVREDVVHAFKKTFSSSSMRRIFRRSAASQWECDLAAANFLVLEEAGVPAKNIAVSMRCTFCERKNFYSYRRENGKTGRMMAFIGMQ